MDVKVDVGDNLTSLLERLAQQIGTTADQVFPWYVAQVWYDGVFTIAILVLFLVILLSVFCIGLWRFSRDNNDDIGAGMAVVSSVLLVLLFIIGASEGKIAATKILNPNYHAVSMLSQDIGKLTGK